MYFTHHKEKNICNIGVLMFQQLSTNKHHRLVTDKTKIKNKPSAQQELHSAHGHTIN